MTMFLWAFYDYGRPCVSITRETGYGMPGRTEFTAA